MKRHFRKIIAGVWVLGSLSPAWAAPTDPSTSGTMDIAHDHNDTNADVNEREGKEAPLDTTAKSKDELDHPGTRHSPKVTPSDSNDSPKVVIPTAPDNSSVTPGTATISVNPPIPSK